MYDEHRGEVYEVRSPSPQKRQSFFAQLFLNGGPDNLSNRSSQGNRRNNHPHCSVTVSNAKPVSNDARSGSDTNPQPEEAQKRERQEAKESRAIYRV